MSHAPAKAAPPPAAPAPAGAGAPPVDPIVATAERLYIDLAVRVAGSEGGAAKVTANAAEIAKLAFTLSVTFHAVELERRPKVELTTATFDANMCDFDGWAKAAQA